MHRLTTLNSSDNLTDNVNFVNQEPAPIVFITAADTDIQILANIRRKLPQDFPKIRAVNVLQLQQQIVIDTYGEEVLSFAQVIILRLIGGRSYWSYGLEVVKATIDSTGAHLIVLPGDDKPDLELISHSTVSLDIANYIWSYLLEGGTTNHLHCLYFIATEFFRLCHPLSSSPGDSSSWCLSEY